MDVEGWQGTVTPFRLRLSDIRPLTAERLDVPPPIHATFETDGVWIVTMCPRPWQTGDAAMMQPYLYHRNVDYDEVYVTLGGGDPVPGGPPDGFLSVIPAGMNHGPSAAMLNMSSRGLHDPVPALHVQHGHPPERSLHRRVHPQRSRGLQRVAAI